MHIDGGKGVLKPADLVRLLDLADTHIGSFALVYEVDAVCACVQLLRAFSSMWNTPHGAAPLPPPKAQTLL